MAIEVHVLPDRSAWILASTLDGSQPFTAVALHRSPSGWIDPIAADDPTDGA